MTNTGFLKYSSVKYAGFNSFGQDAYKRFLGTTYVKIKAGKNDKEVWINASKYIKKNNLTLEEYYAL